MEKRKHIFACIGVGGAFFALYMFTLAPSVLSSDSASFQTRAALPGFRFDARGYAVYTLLSKAFAFIPLGDIAYRVNMLSAVLGALGLCLLSGLVATLTGSSPAGVFAAVSVGLSHMFWTHAVRAEIWTMQVALTYGLVWLLVAWDRNRRWPLFGFCALLAIALFHHRFTLISLPAFAWMAAVKRRRLGPQGAVGWAAAGLAILVLTALMAWGYLDQWHKQRAAQAVTSWLFMEPQFGPALALSPRILARDTAALLGVFGYSLFIPALLLAIVGMLGARTLVGRDCASFLLLLLLTNAGFAFLYNVDSEKPLTYFIPGLAISGVFCGLGLAYAGKRGRISVLWVLIGSQAILAPLLYAVAAPRLAPRLHRFMPSRSVEEIAYWARPWAHSAIQFRPRGEAMMRATPPQAILYCRWATYSTLEYLQRVEGMRRDVALSLAATPSELPPARLCSQGARPVLVERALRGAAKAHFSESVCTGDLCELRCRSRAAAGP